MKKKRVEGDRLRASYDFRGGVRGKYIERLRRGSNLVILDPDVAAAFRDSRAVNRALRGVMRKQSQVRRAAAAAGR
jgi:hypothetical protein